MRNFILQYLKYLKQLCTPFLIITLLLFVYVITSYTIKIITEDYNSVLTITNITLAFNETINDIFSIDFLNASKDVYAYLVTMLLFSAFIATLLYPNDFE